MIRPWLAAVLLTGCATTAPGPIVVTKSVTAPIAVSCVPAELGASPAYLDTDEALLAAAGADERYKLVIAGREQRQARLGELEPVVDSCRKAAK